MKKNLWKGQHTASAAYEGGATLFKKKNSFSPHQSMLKAFINPLILKRWGVMMMMVQSCQSIHKAPPREPCPAPSRPATVLKQKWQTASSFCRSVHSINFMLTVFVHQSDTHTHRQPARRPVCVCQWEERGGRGEHDCPFMWGRGHFFQSRGIFFFFSVF